MNEPTELSVLPSIALSIRQPWAWAILHAGKDIENREWSTRYRGPICIHAGKGMTRGEFQAFVDLARVMERHGQWPDNAWIPEPDELARGAIVGTAEMVDCVKSSASPWFFGSFGFVLRNVRPVRPIPCRGALGFFRWELADA
jgi:hypothetical protein